MTEIFKSKDELEEYFKNLGVEYRFGCYYEKNGEACHLLAEYMTKIQNDIKRSAKVFKDNCDKNNFGRSCTQFGIDLLLGRGCEKDPKKSVNYFSRGCQLDDNEGCFYVGQLLSGSDPTYKDTVEPNIQKSLEYLDKGCQMNKNGIVSGECCFYAHSMYLFGKNGAQQDLAKAFYYAVKGCEFDDMQSCNNLSQMYALGKGTQPNPQMAKKYKNKTIDMLEQIRNQTGIEMGRT